MPRRACRTACRCRGWPRCTSTRRSSSSAGAGPPSPTSTATSTSTSTWPTRACSPASAARRWHGWRPSAWRRIAVHAPDRGRAAVAPRARAPVRAAVWQFTLSATHSNTEAMRIARAVTGRSDVLMFDGKYHGHADELLSTLEQGEVVPRGPRPAARRDPARSHRPVQRPRGGRARAGPRRRRLRDLRGGHHERRRDPPRRRLPRGAAPTGDRQRRTADPRRDPHAVAGPGGLTGRWGLEPDIVVLGKSIANGFPLGAYGMSEQIAGVLVPDPSESFGDGVATGGTLFGNALSLAAARVSLDELLTDAAYDHAAALGERLAVGIETVIAGHACRGARIAFSTARATRTRPSCRSTRVEARERIDLELFNLQRLYMANRGSGRRSTPPGPPAARRRARPTSIAISRSWTTSFGRSRHESARVRRVRHPRRLALMHREGVPDERRAGRSA